MNKIMLSACLSLAAMMAHASSSRDIERSAIVEGTLVIAKDGTVQTATVPNAQKYGKPIADMVQNAAQHWRFYPVLREGEPVLAKAAMHVRVVLRKAAGGNYEARIKGATFGDEDARSSDELSNVPTNVQPRYPEAAIRGRAQGTVYLALRVGRDGHVADVVVEQVNLANIGPENVARQYQDILAKSALDAARQWSFDIPTTGPLAKQDSWTAHVPVKYTLNIAGHPQAEHVWEVYIPGPYTQPPWSHQPNMDDTDAVASDGDVRTDDVGPMLRSPLAPHG